ncbi:MAG: STAS-like domain-containing protein [Deltaproteobacteria bacterium]|nr:STAS-like domain-containing protein [Deltaproteobacteria bacterium]
MRTIIIKNEFGADHITRVAGERLRNMILKAAVENEKVKVDFSGVIIASTSFFDEGFAKLALHGWTKEKYLSDVLIENLDKRDQKVLSEMCRNRGML